jgi:ribose/xylose/arabinose/galactoside ABC-type transport system permease subunit
MKLASFLGLAAMGQTIVMLTGGIDLSIAWVLTASAVVFTSWNNIGPWGRWHSRLISPQVSRRRAQA